MSVDSPPIYQPLAETLTGAPTRPWILFFNGIFDGDAGTAWTPNFENLTEVGTPIITGRYYRINQNICYFWIKIVPATSTSSIAGTTYVDNFPLQFSADSPCWAISGGTGDGPGHIIAQTNRIYVPSWTAVTVPLTVVGIGPAR